MEELFIISLVLICALPVRVRRVSDIRAGSALQCRACRYDLAGIDEHAPCPECGGLERGRLAPEFKLAYRLDVMVALFVLPLVSLFTITLFDPLWIWFYHLWHPFVPDAGYINRGSHEVMAFGFTLALSAGVWLVSLLPTRRPGRPLTMFVCSTPAIMLLALLGEWFEGSVRWSDSIFSITARGLGISLGLVLLMGAACLARRALRRYAQPCASS